MSSNSLFKRRAKPDVVANTSEGKGTKTSKVLGLRKCVEPQDAIRAIDVIFVHGLTGDREKTWTHQSTSRFWPEELLPTDLPDARIFTYGYDADVAHFFSRVSQSRIGDHAQTLLNSVAHVRERTETSDRPLFFVAHSLGGLVVEDMLLSAKNSAEDYCREILESTSGVAFMGTPHCGSQLAVWAKMGTSMAKLVKRVNDSVITVLEPESEVLARIQQEFHTMIRARNDAGKHSMRITCFFEDLETPGVGLVVPKDSAILPAYSSISIPKDHAGMTKFADTEDSGYQRVSGELWIWARDVNKRRNRAFRESDATPPVRPPERPQMLLESSNTANRPPASYFQGSMNNVGQVFQGSNIGTYYGGRS
ncbi:hypothetical protein LTR37_011566 [Vermiconidia calcicola]|uniref:Uncharacterized protein n=1 Tax=Vermiconidia calcicola TaxID=1690605 RepID=A0ACC3N1K0_9PEZI|nr:hypothetical protein LTR37_011566 [Vermiconidia calcicola]